MASRLRGMESTIVVVILVVVTLVIAISVIGWVMEPMNLQPLGWKEITAESWVLRVHGLFYSILILQNNVAT